MSSALSLAIPWQAKATTSCYEQFSSCPQLWNGLNYFALRKKASERSCKLRSQSKYRSKLSSLPRRFCCNSQLGDLAPATSAAYGLLLFGGGLFAYAKSGSKGSLAGGITGAALMGTVYFLMREPGTKATAAALGFGSAFLFAAVFGIRLAASKKLIPAGPLLGLSIFALAVFAAQYLQDNI